MDGVDAESTALPHDLSSEIDFIMRRTYAGTQLDNEVGSA